MASRAEPVGGRPADGRAGSDPGTGSDLPVAPSLRGAVRAAFQDGYYHSWRLLPANVVWAVAVVVLLLALLATPLALLLLPLLALPTAGVFRIATRIARGEAVSFWDAVDAWRTDVRATLAAGAGIAAAGVVLTSNVLAGLTGASPLGWALATLAAWGLVALWLLAWTLWPILLDPDRADRPAVDRVRLAGLLVLAHPLRIGGLALAIAAFLVASTVAIVALATVSVALSALVASRFVLPAADRLEARLDGRAAAAAAPTSGSR